MNGYHSIDCEAFVKRIDAEHAAVKASLARIHRQFNTPEADSGEPVCIPREELQSLRDELAHHFGIEEAGGCLEEAACRCPSLTHEVSRLENEHGELLQKLDELIANTPAHSTTVAFDDFAEFEAMLLGHEARETEIIRHGFNIA